MWIGLGGLVLIGDVIIIQSLDEDEVKTGHQRAGMYFGMSGFLITLSGLLVSSAFSLVMPAFGYSTLLEVQPASVDLWLPHFSHRSNNHWFSAGNFLAMDVSAARKIFCRI